MLYYTYICKNSKCQNFRQDVVLNDKGGASCEACKKPLSGPWSCTGDEFTVDPSIFVIAPAAAPGFDDAVKQVKGQLDTLGKDKGAAVEWCLNVMDFLPKCSTKIQAAFVKDMKKDIDLKMFIGKSSRSADSGVVCVDTALTLTSSQRATGHPNGWKFDWEIPYIMSVAGWELAKECRNYQWVPMKSFLEKCDVGQFVAMTQKGDLGHTVILTCTIPKNVRTVTLTDKQKLGYNYSERDCMAWKARNAANAPTPSCVIDLKTLKVQSSDFKG